MKTKEEKRRKTYKPGKLYRIKHYHANHIGLYSTDIYSENIYQFRKSMGRFRVSRNLRLVFIKWEQVSGSGVYHVIIGDQVGVISDQAVLEELTEPGES